MFLEINRVGLGLGLGLDSTVVYIFLWISILLDVTSGLMTEPEYGLIPELVVGVCVGLGHHLGLGFYVLSN